MLKAYIHENVEHFWSGKPETNWDLRSDEGQKMHAPLSKSQKLKWKVLTPTGGRR